MKELRSEYYGMGPVDYLGAREGIKPVSRLAAENVKLVNMAKNDGLEVKKADPDIAGVEGLTTYIGKNKADIEALIWAEKNDKLAKIGKILGYPDCCAEKFKERRRNDKIANIEQQYLKYKEADEIPFLLNSVLNLSGRIIQDWEEGHRQIGSIEPYYSPHHPCSFDCEKSIEISKKMKEIFEEEFPEIEEEIEELTKKPVVMFDDTYFGVLEGVKSGDSLEYQKVIGEFSVLSEEKKNIIEEGSRIVENGEKLTVETENGTKKELGKGTLVKFVDF